MIFKNTDEIHLDVKIDNVQIAISVAGGFFDLRPPKTMNYKVHSHTSYELHSILEGEAVLECDTETVRLKDGESCIITPGTVHKSISVSENGVKVSFSFFFEEIKSGTSINTFKILTDTLNSRRGVILLGRTPHYAGYLKKTISEFYSESPWREERLKARFLLLLTEMLSDLDRISASSAPDRRQKANGSMYTLTRSLMEEYLTRSYNKSPTLAELSEIVHLSEKQTARLFERYFGLSFGKHIIKLRCDAAKYLLKNTSIPLREIAARVGYTSYNGLLKSFTQTVGISPSEYRLKKKEQ